MKIFILQNFLIFVAVANFGVASAGKHCDRTCGGIKLPYPFGFSAGCEIRLNCTNEDETEIETATETQKKRKMMRIGEFDIHSVTSSNIVVNVTPECHRPVDEVEALFGRNYGLTTKNTLLLQNCRSREGLSNCIIPINLIESKYNISSCTKKTDNVSCYSEEISGDEMLMSNGSLGKVKCEFLFSAILVNQEMLTLNRVELDWWLEGECKCHPHAECIHLSLLAGDKGYRCGCKDGYVGDGYLAGDGCRTASSSHCSGLGYLSKHCGGTPKVIAVIGGIAVGAALMAGFGIFYCLCRRSAVAKNQQSARRLLSEAAGGSGIPFYQYREIEKATSGFDIKQRLGTGAYGTVYAGKLHQDEWVAIKKIKHQDAESIEQVMNEVKLISSVSHPHLVRLLGCCVENGEQILVYEYMPNGTLSQHLQRERGKGLPWSVRLRIASETAHAISYLHFSMNPPIYHRDIKSSNILLDYDFKSKVADFGLSRLGLTEISHISTAPQGTPGYLDPQYHQNFHLSDKSDVYSFGVVLIEIISGLKVVDFSRPHSEVNLAALAIDRIGRGCVDEIIDPFLDPNKDAWTLCTIHKVAELAFRCLAYHSDARPSMMEVAQELELARTSGWSTMEENICIGSSITSTCSSPFNGSEKSLGAVTLRKVGGLGSCRLVVPKKTADCLGVTKEEKECSPVSVQDPWLSEQSSPSTNSLLNNAIQ